MLKKVAKIGVITSLILGVFSINKLEGLGLISQYHGKIMQTEQQAESSEFVIDSQGLLVKYNGNEEEVILPQDVKVISFGAFLDKSRIKRIVLPEGLKKIDEYAFYSCTSLEEIVIPDGVESIGRLAFGNCSSCKKVYLGKGLKEIEEFAFGICDSLEKIEVNEFNSNYSSKDGVLYDKNQKVLKLCPSNIGSIVEIPSTVEVIGEYAFNACRKLEKIFRLEGKPLKIEDAAFYGCDMLTDLNIKGGIEKIGSCAFAECKSIKEFEVEGTVKSIGNRAFMRCESLKEVRFKSRETKIGSNIFVSCPQIIRVESGGNQEVKEYVERRGNKLVLESEEK